MKSRVSKEIRREKRASLALVRLNEIALWRANKRVYVTISNPITTETNRRYIRVEARVAWGDPTFKVKAVTSSSEPE